MSELLQIIPFCFLALIVLIGISTVIGRIILRKLFLFQTGNFFSQFFFESLFGTFVLVTAGSLILTKGTSISLVFLLLAALLYFEKRKYKVNISVVPEFSDQITLKRNSLILILFILFAFLWNSGIVFKFSGFPISEIEKDSYYYAELSKCMVKTGQENTFATADLIDSKYHSPTPYHYFDIWLNGIVAKIFSLNYSISLYLVIYSYFMILFATGIYSCFTTDKKVNLIKIVLSLLLIYVSGMYVTERLMHLYQYQSQMEGMAERYGGKLAAAACLALASIILYAQYKSRSGLILLLALPVVSISLAPSVYGGLFLFSVYKSVSKNEERDFYRRFFIYLILICLGIGSFYYLHKNNQLNYRLDKPFYAYSDLYELSFFRIKFFAVEFFLKSWAQPFLFILNYFPFITAPFLLYFSRKTSSELKTWIQILVCFWICGLTAFSALYLLDDANQLFINMHILWHVLFAFSFTVLYRTEMKYKKAVFLLFIPAMIFSTILSFASYERIDYYGNKISEDYIREVNEEFSKYEGEVMGGVMYDKTYYRNVLISYPIEFYLMPFTFNPKVYTPFNLTPDNIEEKWNQYQFTKAIQRSPFVQFLHEEGKNNRTLIENQKEFISRHKLQYLVVPRSDTNDYSKHFRIKKEVKDRMYGQKILFLTN